MVKWLLSLSVYLFIFLNKASLLRLTGSVLLSDSCLIRATNLIRSVKFPQYIRKSQNWQSSGQLLSLHCDKIDQ